jgi:hypothetical protein
MTNSTDDSRSRLAWRAIVETRTCPPWEILFTSPSPPELEAHVKRCRWCQEDRSQEPEIHRITSQLPAPRNIYPMPREPRVDEIWSLRRDLGGWGSGYRYFNAPSVLVVARSDSAANAFHVAQVCETSAFQGADDVTLPDEIGGFAEPWNIYTVRHEDMDSMIGLAPDGAKAVDAARRNGIQEIDDEPLLKKFRCLEIDVGFHFSSAAVGKIVRRLETEPGRQTWVEGEILAWPIRNKTTLGTTQLQLSSSEPSLVDLVARTYSEIEERDPDSRRLAGRAFPTDPLVELAGRIALSASPLERRTCQRLLWPLVRAALGLDSLASLAQGSFATCNDESNKLIEQYPYFAMGRMAARTSPAREWTDREGSRLAELVRIRLHASWYLAGLEELWPIEGRSAARTLWHEGGLSSWDEQLQDYFHRIVGVEEISQVILELPPDLRSPWYGAFLRELQTFGQPDTGSREAPRDVADARTVGLMLLRSLLSDEVGVTAPEISIRSVECYDGTLFAIAFPGERELGCWIAPDDATELIIEKSTPLGDLVRAGFVVVDDDDLEEPASTAPTLLLKLRGSTSIKGAIEHERIRVPAGDFRGDHQSSLELLRRRLRSVQ